METFEVKIRALFPHHTMTMQANDLKDLKRDLEGWATVVGAGADLCWNGEELWLCQAGKVTTLVVAGIKKLS